jgi:hypothetical protein
VSTLSGVPGFLALKAEGDARLAYAFFAGAVFLFGVVLALIAVLADVLRPRERRGAAKSGDRSSANACAVR